MKNDTWTPQIAPFAPLWFGGGGPGTRLGERPQGGELWPIGGQHLKGGSGTQVVTFKDF